MIFKKNLIMAKGLLVSFRHVNRSQSRSWKRLKEILMLTYPRHPSDDGSIARKTPGDISWSAPVRTLIAAWHEHRRKRLPRELARLSDNMLLDIGIDPRRVPNPAGELIPRPDLSRKGLATPIWRTTAR